MAERSIVRDLADEQATARLGEDIAQALRPGDAIALSGDLGAGKTSLARGLIRALASDPAMEVPSPTFTLVQAYDTRLPIQHFDLYRLASAGDLAELGFDEALATGAVIVEWPDRAAGLMPAGTLSIVLDHHGDGRRATITGIGPTFERVARSLAMRDFLAEAGWGEASRTHLTGDASARSYEIVALEGSAERILMNSPPLVLGPPVRGGRAYAEIAHTARSVAAFVAVDNALAAAGISVPKIHAQDLDQGFLLIEHLGETPFLDPAGQPVAERYAAAAELLAAMHRRPWSADLEAVPGMPHRVPDFDRGAMMIEVDLLLDWYVPWATGSQADAGLADAFHSAWDALFNRLDGAERGLVLRDFHSPNIIWREDRVGLDRLGIIDFQDALIGPTAYDLASLAMDARVTVPREIERSTFARYLATRAADPGFDAEAFEEAYAIMAAQRNSKILGIFVRLDQRDGKPHYLKHLPRIRDYLARSFAHPSLAELAALYRRAGFVDAVSA